MLSMYTVLKIKIMNQAEIKERPSASIVHAVQNISVYTKKFSNQNAVSCRINNNLVHK